MLIKKLRSYFRSERNIPQHSGTSPNTEGPGNENIYHLARQQNNIAANESVCEGYLSKHSLTSQLLLLFIIIGISYFAYVKYSAYQDEKKQTLAVIASPKINDIYFIDFRKLGDEVSSRLRPTEKYRIAKVVDITGNIVTLLYGVFYYQRQHAAVNSIHYGQLRYAEYFETKRYDIPHQEILAMHESEALYLAKRPVRNKLYGNFVSPIKYKSTSSLFILGKKENSRGEGFLQQRYDELSGENAFDAFQQSANLGYPQGQVNLATMYINGDFVKQDLTQALYWLKTASLQSYKPAILKYGIICKQLPNCNVFNFYQELERFGVNIKVRELEVSSQNLVNSPKDH
ncbi:hypothetical protein GCM10009111_28360 [Colwellia asteriadis]|uniref:Sel1 repeat family protein n=1 Tax=Colwellia asteriadis TaxID=517723 RepID=A0ABN1L9R7_9GAMM